MNWDLIVQIIAAIIALFGGMKLTIHMVKKTKNKKYNQKIKGNNNIQAGGNVKIERGSEYENTKYWWER